MATKTVTYKDGLATVGGSGGSGGKGFFTVFFAVAAIIVLGILAYSVFHTGNTQAQPTENAGQGVVVQPVPGRGELTEQDVILNTRDFTDEEWNALANQGSERVVQFNVDVYIPSSHAALQHGAEEMNAALRCVQQNGTVGVISENFTRRLHLLCIDPETKREFVVIIEKIKRSIDEYKNATSNLITAFELKTGSVQANVAAYINGEVNIKASGILVRLAFKAGELFFSPYK